MNINIFKLRERIFMMYMSLIRSGLELHVQNSSKRGFDFTVSYRKIFFLSTIPSILNFLQVQSATCYNSLNNI